MTPHIRHLLVPATASCLATATEFNQWCALNGQPLSLVPGPRPDGRTLWNVEVLAGPPGAVTVFSTGLGDEPLAVVAGFAFLAGLGCGWAARPASPTTAEPAALTEVPGAIIPIPPAMASQPITVPELGTAAKPGPQAEPNDGAPKALTPLGGYSLPPMSLLQPPPHGAQLQEGTEPVANLALETMLQDFRLRGELVEVRPGPVVTFCVVEPHPGSKLSTVVKRLTDNIAHSMNGMAARVFKIPRRIGIELPNPAPEVVYLREVLETDAFRNAPGQLAVVLGKSIGGEAVLADLALMPHLLIAGSNKSVGIHALILSLLYRQPPDRCRFIMIDPEVPGLSAYDGIPHLLTPVVTDSRKAVTALRWAVRETERRYQAFSELGVRNIQGHNARVVDMIGRDEKMPRSAAPGETGSRLEQPHDAAPLPYVVVIVAEMADLMLVAGKDVEVAVQHLAQRARSVGIHLIIGTERPSVDVITGTIKANIPTRISFRADSGIDSRTILNENGAEQLIGQGDMLFMQGGHITRVHGPLASDSEVEKIVQHLMTQGAPSYLAGIVEEDAGSKNTDPLCS
jgi:S-DNA-T family DNA segregation ATPase FtsK/SpoIIIE